MYNLIGAKPSVEDNSVYQRLLAAKKYNDVFVAIIQDSTNGMQKIVNINFVLKKMKKEGYKFIVDTPNAEEKEIIAETFELINKIRQETNPSRTEFNNVRNSIIKYFKRNPEFSEKFIKTVITFLKTEMMAKYV